jgi:deaminated glutathione amidase
MKVAAVQLEPALGDVAENLRRCEALADEAGRRGAEWIVLPEFFSTGMAFLDRIADASLPPDGAATQLMLALARRHAAVGVASTSTVTVGPLAAAAYPDPP